MDEENFQAPNTEDEDDGEWPESKSDEEYIDEEECEEDPNSAWAKDAAMYDSSLEEEFSSEEDSELDSDDDDERVGWESIRHRTGKMRKRKRKCLDGVGTPRKTFVKRRPIREDIDPIPELSTEEKYTRLQRITHDKLGTILLRRFLQCLLFDLDFRYTLLSHQFIGALGVSGVDSRPLCNKFVKMDEDSQALLIELSAKGKQYRRKICAEVKFVKTKGILLADDMGLGKTIQGLSGAVLRQAIQSIKSKVQSQDPKSNDKKKKVIQKNMPTAIIGPNKDVLDQWEESLLRAGIPRARIKYFHPQDNRIERGNTFVLMTRYQLFTEFRSFIECHQSNLFGYPKLSVEFVKMLKQCYDAGHHMITNELKERDETESECITKILRSNAEQIKIPMFRTILIDEAHFLKNLQSYWGMGTALLGMMSERSVPLSGTPYNNGTQDMATLMTFIDPFQPSAIYNWWDRAGDNNNFSASQVREWRNFYLIRRDKSELAVKLPPKIILKHPVAARANELEIYSYYEATFFKGLKEFSKIQDLRTQQQRMRQKELFTVLMATMTCMRMCLIHPLVPGGREYTIRFSPSRRNMLSQFDAESSETCVCCSMHLSQKVQKKHASENPASKNPKANVIEQELAALSAVGGAITEDEQMQDADFDRPGNGNRRNKNNKRTRREAKERKCIRLSSKYCRACNECPHYIHEKCLEKMLKEDPSWTCPRCDDLENRLRVGQSLAADRPLYCEHIVCGGERGIRATAKINEVVNWAQALPKNEKAIMYSFFKGGLDILEGIFVEDLKIDCARFDGDKTPEERSKELSRFKSSNTCRILLASVQSSGVGLNIVEANHIAFLDRWFNPCVHAQAEDRCHRLNQTKKVRVTYFDTSMTVDEVMSNINDMKTKNASVLLADGSDIGAGQSGMKFRDLRGFVGDMMHAVAEERIKFNATKTSPDQVYVPINKEVLIETANQREMYNMSRVKTEKSSDAKDSKFVTKDTTDRKPSAHAEMPEVKETAKSAHLNIVQTKGTLLSTENTQIDVPAIKKNTVTENQSFTYESSVRAGEYQVDLPVVTIEGNSSLLIRISKNKQGQPIFVGYSTYPDGTKGPTEAQGLIKNIGDRFIDFDGVDTSDMQYTEFLSLVKERVKKGTSVRVILLSNLKRIHNVDKNLHGSLHNNDEKVNDPLSSFPGTPNPLKAGLGVTVFPSKVVSPSKDSISADAGALATTTPGTSSDKKKKLGFFDKLNKDVDDLSDGEEVNDSHSHSPRISTPSNTGSSNFASHPPRPAMHTYNPKVVVTPSKDSISADARALATVTPKLSFFDKLNMDLGDLSDDEGGNDPLSPIPGTPIPASIGTSEFTSHIPMTACTPTTVSPSQEPISADGVSDTNNGYSDDESDDESIDLVTPAF